MKMQGDSITDTNQTYFDFNNGSSINKIVSCKTEAWVTTRNFQSLGSFIRVEIILFWKYIKD